MKHTSYRLVASLVMLSACSQEESPRPEAASGSAPVILAQSSGSTPSASSSVSTPVAPSSCEPQAKLATLDQRKPVPLLPMMAWHQKQNMMEHLVAIQRITAGVAVEDWKEVGAGAKLIGSSPKMQMMCQHMGAGAPGFTEQALEFHNRADRIGEAAERKDAKAVMAATAHTLKACTGCHAGYRQNVVSHDEWQKSTGSSPPTGHPGGHVGHPGH